MSLITNLEPLIKLNSSAEVDILLYLIKPFGLTGHYVKHSHKGCTLHGPDESLKQFLLKNPMFKNSSHVFTQIDFVVILRRHLASEQEEIKDAAFELLRPLGLSDALYYRTLYQA